MESQTVNKLISKAREGDAGAFEELVNSHYTIMYKMAYKWCGNQKDAEDITQEACIKLARGLGSFKGDSAFTSWLYRLVINAGKDWYKKQNRHLSNLANPASPEEIENISAPDNSEEKLYATQVIKAVYALPEDEKEAILLVMSRGLSHKEAAEVMGCKEGTISWRIHEARKKLSAHVGKEHSYG